MFEAGLILLNWVDVEHETQLSELIEAYEDMAGREVFKSAESLLDEFDDGSNLAYFNNDRHRFEYGVLYNHSDQHRYQRVDEVVNSLKDTQKTEVFIYSIRFFHSLRKCSTSLPTLFSDLSRVHFVMENITVQNADAAVTPAQTNHRGRPPLAYEMVDGELIRSDNYEKVCRELRRVQEGRRSKREAAQNLDVTRKTITNCLDRPKMYRLNR